MVLVYDILLIVLKSEFDKIPFISIYHFMYGLILER